VQIFIGLFTLEFIFSSQLVDILEREGASRNAPLVKNQTYLEHRLPRQCRTNTKFRKWKEMMNGKFTKWLMVVGIFTLSLMVFAGAALAQDDAAEMPAAETPAAETQTRLERMQERMGPQAWAEMIAHMAEKHGPEFTAQMLERMEEEGGCHGEGVGFMGRMRGMHDGESEGLWGNMMRGFRGMMGDREQMQSHRMERMDKDSDGEQLQSQRMGRGMMRGGMMRGWDSSAP
jgi:hypothetical protein